MIIKIENQDQLSHLCGPNDIHLKHIMEITGDRVFSYGNEIIIEPSDDKKEKAYRILIAELGELALKNPEIDEKAIKDLISSIQDGDTLKREILKGNKIQLSTKTSIFPRTLSQAVYMEALDKFEINFGIGPAGTGKTYIAVAHALSQIINKKKRKLLLTRPVVEAGESLGFLPGDLSQKISPYLKPIYDVMDFLIGPEKVVELEEKRIIEVAPLAYMRGRSLNNCIIILDEAQNTTQSQMKMFLTRLGEGSQAIITGDVTQVDLPKRDQSGLIHAARLLSNIDGIHFTHFKREDVVRNPLIASIIKAYDNEN